MTLFNFSKFASLPLRHHKLDVPRLPHLREFLHDDEKAILEQPIQLRKGYSYKKMLGEVLTSRSR